MLCRWQFLKLAINHVVAGLGKMKGASAAGYRLAAFSYAVEVCVLMHFHSFILKPLVALLATSETQYFQ